MLKIARAVLLNPKDKDNYVVVRDGQPLGITIRRKSPTVWQAQRDEGQHVIVRAASPGKVLTQLNNHLIKSERTEP